MMTSGARALRLGLRANLAQFSLLVGVNALVGGMLGQERTVVPLLAGPVFHVPGHTAALTFIVAFGLAKAATNYVAGTVLFTQPIVNVQAWHVVETAKRNEDVTRLSVDDTKRQISLAVANALPCGGRFRAFAPSRSRA